MQEELKKLEAKEAQRAQRLGTEEKLAKKKKKKIKTIVRFENIKQRAKLKFESLVEQMHQRKHQNDALTFGLL